MSVFGRLSNLWRGFLSLWISDLERNNPQIAYENNITSMVQKYTMLKMATASIIRRRDEISQRLDRESRELFQITSDLENALSTDQDDLATVLLQKQESLERSLSDLKLEQEQSDKDAEDAKSSLLEVKQKIGELKAEKDRMIAKLNSAEARIKINEQLEGLSVDAEVQSLEVVREHIKNKVSEANLTSELNETDLDSRLKKLRQSSGSVNAKQKLAELKAARAGAHAKVEEKKTVEFEVSK